MTSDRGRIERRPDLVRAVVGATVSGAVLALAMGLMAGLLEIQAGLVVVCAVGGWAIGRAAVAGAWGEPFLGDGIERPASPQSLRSLAVVIAALVWLAGLLVHWVVALAALPEAQRGIVERLRETPFPDWYGPQAAALAPWDLLALLAAVVFAWRASR